MELDFAIIAEKAEPNPKGLLHLFGGGLNIFDAHAFPALGQFTLALKFVGEPHEHDATHALSLGIVNPAGENHVISSETEFKLGIDSGDPYNQPAALLIMQLAVAFTAPGLYLLRVGLDGKELRTMRFVVRRGGEAPSAKQQHSCH